MAAASPSKRRDTDMMKLMMSDYKVHIPDESCLHDFCVIFKGPKETPYEGGSWKVHVTLPQEYPFKSPSIGFMNRLFHPNVDEMSGSVCLDVINQSWSPMFDLVNIFDAFLPQLLRYPNPNDPLNGEAATLLLRDAEKYNDRVRDYVKRYASQPITMEPDDEDSKVKKPPARGRSSSSSSSTTTSPASSASSSFSSSDGGLFGLRTPVTSPESRPMEHHAALAAMRGSGPCPAGAVGYLTGGHTSLYRTPSSSSSNQAGSSSSSSPEGEEEEDDGNDSDVSELSDIEV